MIGYIGIFVAFSFFTFFEPVLADRLQIDFDYDSEEVAYFYSIFTLSGFLSALVLALFPLKSNLPYWAGFAYVLGIIALILMGPNDWIGLPDSTVIIGVGLFLLSSSTQLLRVASTVMILNALKSRHPSQIHRISKLLGSLNEIIVSVTFLVTPLSSSAIYKMLGYKEICNVMAVVSCMGLLLLIVVTMVE